MLLRSCVSKRCNELVCSVTALQKGVSRKRRFVEGAVFTRILS